MSAASESFSACQAIEEGRWDRHLLQIVRAVHMRLGVIDRANVVVAELASDG